MSGDDLVRFANSPEGRKFIQKNLFLASKGAGQEAVSPLVSATEEMPSTGLGKLLKQGVGAGLGLLGTGLDFATWPFLVGAPAAVDYTAAAGKDLIERLTPGRTFEEDPYVQAARGMENRARLLTPSVYTNMLAQALGPEVGGSAQYWGGQEGLEALFGIGRPLGEFLGEKAGEAGFGPDTQALLATLSEFAPFAVAHYAGATPHGRALTKKTLGPVGRRLPSPKVSPEALERYMAEKFSTKVGGKERIIPGEETYRTGGMAEHKALMDAHVNHIERVLKTEGVEGARAAYVTSANQMRLYAENRGIEASGFLDELARRVNDRLGAGVPPEDMRTTPYTPATIPPEVITPEVYGEFDMPAGEITPTPQLPYTEPRRLPSPEGITFTGETGAIPRLLKERFEGRPRGTGGRVGGEVVPEAGQFTGTRVGEYNVQFGFREDGTAVYRSQDGRSFQSELVANSVRDAAEAFWGGEMEFRTVKVGDGFEVRGTSVSEEAPPTLGGEYPPGEWARTFPMEKGELQKSIKDVADRIFSKRKKSGEPGFARGVAPQKAEVVPQEIWNRNTTGTSHWDGLLKAKEAKVVEMSPREFLDRVAEMQGVDKGWFESALNEELLTEYIQRMQAGEKAPLPILDLIEKTQEGRYRALAAEKIGAEKIPVVLREPAEPTTFKIKQSWQELQAQDQSLLSKVKSWLLGEGEAPNAPTRIFRGIPRGAQPISGVDYTHGTPWGFSAARGGKGGFGDPKAHDVYAYPAGEDTVYYRGGSLAGDPLESTRILNVRGMTWSELLEEARRVFNEEVAARSREFIDNRKFYEDMGASATEADRSIMENIAEHVLSDFRNASFETDVSGRMGVWEGFELPKKLAKETPGLRSNASLRRAIGEYRRQGKSEEWIARTPEYKILERSGQKIPSRSQKSAESIAKKHGLEFVGEDEMVLPAEGKKKAESVKQYWFRDPQTDMTFYSESLDTVGKEVQALREIQDANTRMTPENVLKTIKDLNDRFESWKQGERTHNIEDIRKELESVSQDLNRATIDEDYRAAVVDKVEEMLGEMKRESDKFNVPVEEGQRRPSRRSFEKTRANLNRIAREARVYAEERKARLEEIINKNQVLTKQEFFELMHDLYRKLRDETGAVGYDIGLSGVAEDTLKKLIKDGRISGEELARLLRSAGVERKRANLIGSTLDKERMKPTTVPAKSWYRTDQEAIIEIARIFMDNEVNFDGTYATGEMWKKVPDEIKPKIKMGLTAETKGVVQADTAHAIPLPDNSIKNGFLDPPYLISGGRISKGQTVGRFGGWKSEAEFAEHLRGWAREAGRVWQEDGHLAVKLQDPTPNELPESLFSSQTYIEVALNHNSFAKLADMPVINYSPRPARFQTFANQKIPRKAHTVFSVFKKVPKRAWATVSLLDLIKSETGSVGYDIRRPETRFSKDRIRETRRLMKEAKRLNIPLEQFLTKGTYYSKRFIKTILKVAEYIQKYDEQTKREDSLLSSTPPDQSMRFQGDTSRVISQNRYVSNGRVIDGIPVTEWMLNELMRTKNIDPAPFGRTFETPTNTTRAIDGGRRGIATRSMEEGRACESNAMSIFKEYSNRHEQAKKLLGGIRDRLRSKKRLLGYFIGRQERGKGLLEHTKVDYVSLENLTPSERAYVKAVDSILSDFAKMINDVRVKIGLEPMEVLEDYFTFARDMSLAELEGQIIDFATKPLHELAKAREAVFKNAIERRGGKYKLLTDPYAILDRYIYNASKHIGMSPIVAKLGVMLDKHKLPNGKTFLLDSHAPRSAKWLRDYQAYLAGWPTDKWRLPPNVERTIKRISSNLAYSILAGNVRTAGIQVSALRNTVTAIGPDHTFGGLRDVLSPERREFAMKNSDILSARELDASVIDMTRGISGAYSGAQRAVAKVAMVPLKFMDMMTAKATWLGAFRMAEKMGMKGADAFRFADDIVVRTQGSSMMADLAPIQRHALGRFLTTFQTFVINDWNFLVKDVLGIRSPVERTNVQAVKTIATYLAATTLFNIFYEDILGWTSPFPNIPGVLKEAKEKGWGTEELILGLIKEPAEQFPFFGGGLRYGSSPLGAGINLGQELVTAFDPNNPRRQPYYKVVGQLIGFPGTSQLIKSGRAYGRGGNLYDIIAGRYIEKQSTSLEGLPGLKGLEGL